MSIPIVFPGKQKQRTIIVIYQTAGNIMLDIKVHCIINLPYPVGKCYFISISYVCDIDIHSFQEYK